MTASKMIFYLNQNYVILIAKCVLIPDFPFIPDQLFFKHLVNGSMTEFIWEISKNGASQKIEEAGMPTMSIRYWIISFNLNR